MHGQPIIWRDFLFVIRADRSGDHEIKVMVHRVDSEGNELRPGGYVLGHNMLILKTPGY